MSNIVTSVAEDGLTAGGLWLVFAHPEVAIVVAAVLALGVGLLLWWASRLLGPLWRRWRGVWGEK